MFLVEENPKEQDRLYKYRLLTLHIINNIKDNNQEKTTLIKNPDRPKAGRIAIKI